MLTYTLGSQSPKQSSNLVMGIEKEHRVVLIMTKQAHELVFGNDVDSMFNHNITTARKTSGNGTSRFDFVAVLIRAALAPCSASTFSATELKHIGTIWAVWSST
jgi:hypothetical protein